MTTTDKRTYGTERAATAAATRVGAPNTVPGAVRGPNGWQAAVYLRDDQRWMAAHVLERGAMPLFCAPPQPPTTPTPAPRADGYPAAR